MLVQFVYHIRQSDGMLTGLFSSMGIILNNAKLSLCQSSELGSRSYGALSYSGVG